MALSRSGQSRANGSDGWVSKRVCSATSGTSIARDLMRHPLERCSSFSSASAILRLFPQPLHVAHRWDAEEAFVLAIEVRGVAVAHAIGRTRRVEVFAQHQTAGLQQPQPLLELQRAQRRNNLEVVVEC